MRVIKTEKLKLTVTLVVVCAVSACFLTLAYKTTQPQIDKQEKLQTIKALKSVLPHADQEGFREIKKEGISPYYEGYAQDKLVGCCLICSQMGYGGDIEVLVGIDVEGRITGIKILKHQETPGLGAGIEEPHFLEQFRGKKAADLNYIQAITGATISSKAVAEAVKSRVEEFMSEINSPR